MRTLGVAGNRLLRLERLLRPTARSYSNLTELGSRGSQIGCPRPLAKLGQARLLGYFRGNTSSISSAAERSRNGGEIWPRALHGTDCPARKSSLSMPLSFSS
jgi:hypothetical protein